MVGAPKQPKKADGPVTGGRHGWAFGIPLFDLADHFKLRRDRMSAVHQVIEVLTAASLDGHTEPVEGPGWPAPRSCPVRECLLIILNEEWEHRLYAERDLNTLEAR